MVAEAFSCHRIFYFRTPAPQAVSVQAVVRNVRSCRSCANASSLAIAAPTRLSGVEAPEVRPTATGPAGSQPFGRDLGFGPDGPVADLVGRHQAVRIGDVECRPGRGADARQVAGIAAVVAADHDHQVDRPVREQRDDRVLPILRGAADRVERLEMGGQVLRRRSGRAWPPSSSRRSRATPTSASSSGSRGRCAAGRDRDRSPATRRRRTASRKASRSPPLRM